MTRSRILAGPRDRWVAHGRTPLGEVLFATFTEADARAGKAVSDKVRLRQKVDRLPENGFFERAEKTEKQYL